MFFFRFSAALTLSLRNSLDQTTRFQYTNMRKSFMMRAIRNLIFRYSISEVILIFDFRYSISILELQLLIIVLVKIVSEYDQEIPTYFGIRNVTARISYFQYQNSLLMYKFEYQNIISIFAFWTVTVFHVNPYKSSVLSVGRRQTVETQTRQGRMWCLIRVSTVCLQKYLSKIEYKLKLQPNTPNI